jgi:hypothetical protein
MLILLLITLVQGVEGATEVVIVDALLHYNLPAIIIPLLELLRRLPHLIIPLDLQFDLNGIDTIPVPLIVIDHIQDNVINPPITIIRPLILIQGNMVRGIPGMIRGVLALIVVDLLITADTTLIIITIHPLMIKGGIIGLFLLDLQVLIPTVPIITLDHLLMIIGLPNLIDLIIAITLCMRLTNLLRLLRLLPRLPLWLNSSTPFMMMVVLLMKRISMIYLLTLNDVLHCVKFNILPGLSH